MTREEAIEAIKCNWPDSRYTILREALDMAVKALEDVTDKDVWKMTNADRIRAMTDEELAKLLLDGCRGSKCADQPQNEWGSVNCIQCRMNWLQQPLGKALTEPVRQRARGYRPSAKMDLEG